MSRDKQRADRLPTRTKPKKAKIPRLSKGEETLAAHIRASKLPTPVREFKFMPDRRYRFDFAWPDLQIAVEVEGGTWGRGRHNSGAGFEADAVKYNLATKEFWAVFRFTTRQVTSGEAIEFLKGVLG